MVESNDLAFWIHLPHIGASRLKLERKPDPHWKHLRLYIFPFGFQRLNMLIIIFQPFSTLNHTLDMLLVCVVYRSSYNNISMNCLRILKKMMMVLLNQTFLLFLLLYPFPFF